MTKPLLCIYHANCLDGFTAAWAVWKRFPDTEFYPGHYNETPPDCTGREVIMVDFSYKRPVLLEIAEKAKNILILDHHKSAQSELVDLPANVIAEFDMDRSGAMMAWNHYHPDIDEPDLVHYVQDRDLWRFQFDNTKPFCAHLFCLDFSFEEWERVYAITRVPRDYDQFLETGKVLEQKHIKDTQAIIEIGTSRRIFEGFEVPILNAPFMFASEAGNRLSKGEPFSITWYETENHRVFSLRSDESGMDVSEIARKYNGGGHRHAAGFKLPKENFKWNWAI